MAKQNIDFGASPAGAKNTFVQAAYKDYSFTSTKTDVVTTKVYTEIPPPPPSGDPVAQTFIIDPTNYPNGVFLSSLRVFFKTKPTSVYDNTPVTLSIVGTLNGYPNGTTLDHSIVTLSPNQVKVSDSPQYLDSTTDRKSTRLNSSH